MIDTLKLQRAGFTDTQIEALAELVTGEVATKADVQLARAEIELKVEELRRETREMETRLVDRIEGLAWKVTMALVAQAASIVALIKLLPGG